MDRPVTPLKQNPPDLEVAIKRDVNRVVRRIVARAIYGGVLEVTEPFLRRIA